MKLASRRFLFVCTGNTCRSPMARFLLERKAREKGLHWSAESAGISAVPGAPMTTEALKVLTARDIDGVAHKAQRLDPNLIGRATEIYAMTIAQQDHILQLYPFAAKKLDVLRRAAGLTPTDVADPIGQSDRAYELCARSIEEALDILIQRSTHAPSR